MSFSVTCSVLLLAALASLPACSARSTAGERSTEGVRVELDIFSGRPNPTWELSQEQGRELRERIARLPRVADGTFPDPLGYRGIAAVLRGPDGREESIRLFAGTVRHQTQDATLFLNDAGRQVERWLAETGAPHLDPGVYQSVLNELGAR